MSQAWWVYIAKLETGVLYVGMTSNLARRQQWFRDGRGHAGRQGFVCIPWSEEHPNRVSAHRRERQLKGWSGAKKLALIAGDLEAVRRLSRSRKGDNSP